MGLNPATLEVVGLKKSSVLPTSVFDFTFNWGGDWSPETSSLTTHSHHFFAMAPEAVAAASTPPNKKGKLVRMPSGDDGVFLESDISFPCSQSRKGSVVRLRELPFGGVLQVDVDGGSIMFERLDAKRIRCNHTPEPMKSQIESGKMPTRCDHNCWDLECRTVNMFSLKSHAGTHFPKKPKVSTIPLGNGQRDISKMCCQPSKKAKKSRNASDGSKTVAADSSSSAFAEPGTIVIP